MCKIHRYFVGKYLNQMFWKCQDDIKYSEITQGLKPSLRYEKVKREIHGINFRLDWLLKNIIRSSNTLF